jgi:hypothetical protein
MRFVSTISRVVFLISVAVVSVSTLRAAEKKAMLPVTLLLSERYGTESSPRIMSPDIAVKGTASFARDGLVGNILVSEDATKILIGKTGWKDYTVEFPVRLSLNSLPLTISVFPSEKDARHPYEALVCIHRTDTEGNILSFQAWAYDGVRDLPRFRRSFTLAFRPSDKTG